MPKCTECELHYKETDGLFVAVFNFICWNCIAEGVKRRPSPITPLSEKIKKVILWKRK